ncbi:MAG: aminotransferase class V-fold PLP-dependent enzyme, partial [Propionibacteriaceae bacterium]|nr:aminotransferase class V-fold PLP-dependent enzyme [Propionibacteriaceae bacterium]
EDARDALAAALGAHPSEVVFTSGGSEADTIAVLGSTAARRAPALVAATEHPAVRGATASGAQLWPVDTDGRVRLDQMPAGEFSVVSVMGVNNETGVHQPVAEVAELARSRGAWAHSDAVQQAGHEPFCFASSGLDLASVSAHKIGGPVGIGALLVRREVGPAATGLGGGQERKLRSGTQPAMLAASFAAAMTEAVAQLDQARARYLAWRGRVLDVALGLPEVRSASAEAPSSPHIVNLTFAGLRADDLLVLLDAAGIDASVGSACQAGVHQPSEVLLAMGRTAHEALASVRFSFGHTTTDADIDRLLAVLPDAVARARAAYA